MVLSTAAFCAFVLSSCFFVSGVTSFPSEVPWKNASWHYRYLFDVDTGNYNRSNCPVELPLDLSPFITGGNVLDMNSFRLYENGTMIPVDAFRNDGNNFTVVFQVSGERLANETIPYEFYFDVTANGVKPVSTFETTYDMQQHYFKRFGRNPVQDTVVASDNITFSLLRDYWTEQHGDWHLFTDWVFGESRASLHKEKVIQNGSTWIKQTIDNKLYRYGLKMDTMFKENISSNAHAEAVFNYSSGNTGLDKGLHVITDQGLINIDALDWDSAYVLSNETVHHYDCYNRTWGSGESLKVIPMVFSSKYIILYDNDFPNGTKKTSWDDWNTMAIRMYDHDGHKNEMRDVLFEFWKNTTDGGLVSNYFINFTFNTNWWWADRIFNIDNHTGEPMHDYQYEGVYPMGLSWMKPENETQFQQIIEDQIASDENPVSVVLKGIDLPVPMSMEVQEMRLSNGHIVMNVTFTGDTLSKRYYTINDGIRIQFSGVDTVDASPYTPVEGKYIIDIIMEDSNMTTISRRFYLDAVSEDFQGYYIYISIGAIAAVLIVVFLAVKHRRKTQKTRI